MLQFLILSHRILDSFPWILKLNIITLKPVLLAHKDWRPGLNFILLYSWKIVCNMMFPIFKYGMEPVLIQRFQSHTGNKFTSRKLSSSLKSAISDTKLVSCSQSRQNASFQHFFLNLYIYLEFLHNKLHRLRLWEVLALIIY